MRETLVRPRHTICRMCTHRGKLEEAIFTASRHGKCVVKSMIEMASLTFLLFSERRITVQGHPNGATYFQLKWKTLKRLRIEEFYFA